MSVRSKKPELARGGFALVEVAVAATILAIAVGGLVGTVIYTMRLARVSEERTTAQQAAVAMGDFFYSVDFANIYASFNDDPADDPGGAGAAPGSGFAVPGLNVQVGDADGFVGRVIFPTVTEVGGTTQWLREDFEDDDLGMPRDLNADGDIDDLDHSADYSVLPVTVRIQWTGGGGDQTRDFHLLLIP